MTNEIERAGKEAVEIAQHVTNRDLKMMHSASRPRDRFTVDNNWGLYDDDDGTVHTTRHATRHATWHTTRHTTRHANVSRHPSRQRVTTRITPLVTPHVTPRFEARRLVFFKSLSPPVF